MIIKKSLQLEKLSFALILLIYLFVPNKIRAQEKNYAFLEGNIFSDSQKRQPLQNFTLSIPELSYRETIANGTFNLAIPLGKNYYKKVTLKIEKNNWGSYQLNNFFLVDELVRYKRIAILEKEHKEEKETDYLHRKYPLPGLPPLYEQNYNCIPSLSPNTPPLNLSSLNAQSSNLAWIFAQKNYWVKSGYGEGQGDHFGDDWYAHDWNYLPPNCTNFNGDEGRTLLASFSGEVIYVKNNYPSCSANVCWYGNQVIIANSEGFALRYTHMKDVWVKKGEKVQQFQPIGSVGYSGLSGIPPYSAHLHIALYKNIDQISGKKIINSPTLQTGRFWLEKGATPECLMSCRYPSQFSTSFVLNKSNKLPFVHLQYPNSCLIKQKEIINLIGFFSYLLSILKITN